MSTLMCTAALTKLSELFKKIEENKKKIQKETGYIKVTLHSYETVQK